MSSPRLVATDLDGTLLGSDGQVSPRTRRVLEDLDAAGVTVVFVTGRPVRWMDSLWEHVGDHGIAICSNGGVVYDVHEHRVVTARTISRDVGLETADLVRSVAPASRFALERVAGFATEPNFRSHSSDAGRRTDLLVGPLDEVFGDDVVKMLALDNEADPATYRTVVDRTVGHLVTTTYSVVGSLVEMSAA
ncbi:MAG: HAD-IIB family hydrolase, partial [Nocardioidaceae bacterium]